MKFRSLGGNPVQNHFGWAQRVSTESNTQKRFKVEGVSANVAINPITCVPDASKYMVGRQPHSTTHMGTLSKALVE